MYTIHYYTAAVRVPYILSVYGLPTDCHIFVMGVGWVSGL